MRLTWLLITIEESTKICMQKNCGFFLLSHGSIWVWERRLLDSITVYKFNPLKYLIIYFYKHGAIDSRKLPRNKLMLLDERRGKRVLWAFSYA